jgi:hypothetical protein
MIDLSTPHALEATKVLAEKTVDEKSTSSTIQSISKNIQK